MATQKHPLNSLITSEQLLKTLEKAASKPNSPIAEATLREIERLRKLNKQVK